MLISTFFVFVKDLFGWGSSNYILYTDRIVSEDFLNWALFDQLNSHFYSEGFSQLSFFKLWCHRIWLIFSDYLQLFFDQLVMHLTAGLFWSVFSFVARLQVLLCRTHVLVPTWAMRSDWHAYTFHPFSGLELYYSTFEVFV